MAKTKKIERTWSEKYALVKANFSEGGNGKVSKVKNIATGDTLVIKELMNFSDIKEGRFNEEIDIMYKNYKKIDGIMPIYDFSKDEFWYVMPEAELLTDYIKKNKVSFDAQINIIISFATILKELHYNDISHRDIKPLNLYMMNEKTYFGDFGLADFPDKTSDYTKNEKQLGAKYTMAPEMRRNPDTADGKKADVYSFAKTIWMILMINEMGFDGQYNRNDPMISISKSDQYKDVHLKELEDLLTLSTDNDPEKRPSIDECLKILCDYRDIKADKSRSQLSDWKYISNQIFMGNEPSNCSWNNIDTIINILNIIGRNPAYNHMFYSSTGGLDFEYAKKAAEEGCIELYAGGFKGEPDIVKPKQLIFQGFEDDYSWNYFLLELDELEPIEPFRWDNEYEVLVEDMPGHYVSSDYYQYGVYDYDTGEKFPEGWKLVRRYKRGKMLIMLKAVGYNKVTAVYDGRHAECSPEELKIYIQEMIKAEKWAKEKHYDTASVLNHFFKMNPFGEKHHKNNDIDELNKRPSGREYIKNNYNEWFINIGDSYKIIDSKIRFKIIFDEDGGERQFYQLFEERQEIVLCKDGTLKKKPETDEVMWLYSREDALALESRLDSLIKEQCEMNGYEYPEYSPYTVISIDKCGIPEHLFTLEELIEELRKADDRHSNTVVVDENGWVSLVRENEYLYPVRNETFQAGNKYVGKYADVEGVAKDLYPTLLGDWLDYLKSGRNHYIDYYEYNDSDVEGFKKEILAIMSKN